MSASTTRPLPPQPTAPAPDLFDPKAVAYFLEQWKGERFQQLFSSAAELLAAKHKEAP